MMRLLALACIAVLAVYATTGAALLYFQRALVFANDKTDLPPAAVGLPDVEVHLLVTSDHINVVSWLLRGNGDNLVIYFHGNGGSLPSRVTRIRQLADMGLSVLAIDYRGFGGSAGLPSEVGLMRDADAAYELARKLGYPSERILLYGESLGTSVAVSLAARHAVGGVMLDAAFSSIADVAADRYWMFPVRALLRDPFRSDLQIGRLTMPVLMLHGTDDSIVPIRFGRALLAKAGPRATFIAIEGGGHVVFDDQKAQSTVKAWLEPFIMHRLSSQ